MLHPHLITEVRCRGRQRLPRKHQILQLCLSEHALDARTSLQVLCAAAQRVTDIADYALILAVLQDSDQTLGLLCWGMTQNQSKPPKDKGQEKSRNTAVSPGFSAQLSLSGCSSTPDFFFVQRLTRARRLFLRLGSPQSCHTLEQKSVVRLSLKRAAEKTIYTEHLPA